jgi:hypothetical protein
VLGGSAGIVENVLFKLAQTIAKKPKLTIVHVFVFGHA